MSENYTLSQEETNKLLLKCGTCMGIISCNECYYNKPPFISPIKCNIMAIEKAKEMEKIKKLKEILK